MVLYALQPKSIPATLLLVIEFELMIGALSSAVSPIPTALLTNVL
jgi:hypothetical protein